MEPVARKGRPILWGPLALAAAAVAASVLAARAAPGEAATRSRLAPYRLPLAPPPNVDADVDAYERRVRRNPDGALDRALLAKAYAQKARRAGPRWYEEAERHARESLAKLPAGNAGAKVVLAQAALARHEFAVALDLLDEVRRERPGGAEALSIAVAALLAQGRVAEAARLADDLVARLPTMTNYVTHGLAMAASGRDPEAVYDFERAIDLEEQGDVEESSRARALLGRVHLRHGRGDAARDLFLEAIRIDPGNVQALDALAELEMKEGKFREAAGHYSDAFQRSGEARYLGRKAAARAGDGDAASAAELYGEAVRLLRSSLSKDSYGHRRSLAECLLDRAAPGDAAEALALLESELEVRRDAETLAALARARAVGGRLREAQSAVREALRTGVEDAGLHLTAARIEREIGNARRATFHLERAASIDPTCGETNP